MVPCVSPKWKLTVSNHIWSICAEKFFFDVLNHFSFPDFCTNDFYILPVISQPLFPSLEIIFEWLRNIILISKVNMTSKRLCSFWPVPRFLTFHFTISGNWPVLGIVFISHSSLFHFTSRILVIFIASWMIFLEIGFFIISFLTRWYFVFPRWRWVGNWSFFWISLVLSIDMIWLRDFNVRVYVGLWMPDVDFAFYVFFFKITALDSVWFLDNLLLSDYLSVRGEVPNLTGHWFHFILFSQPWEFQRNSFFLFLFFSSSAKLSRDFHSRIFTQIEFFWLKSLLIMNFSHLYSARGGDRCEW